MDIGVGSTITLRGKSLKGKNRIREHGATWAIVDYSNIAMCFNNQPAWYVRSEATGHERWIRQNDDRDFVIMEAICSLR